MGPFLSYLISLNPLPFKNISYVGPFNYFAFVYHQHFAVVQSLARSLCFVLQPPHPTQFSSPPLTKVNFSHCHRHHCYRHCCRRNNHPRRTFDIQPFGTGEHCGVFKNWHFLKQKQNLFKSTIQKYISIVFTLTIYKFCIISCLREKSFWKPVAVWVNSIHTFF